MLPTLMKEEQDLSFSLWPLAYIAFTLPTRQTVWPLANRELPASPALASRRSQMTGLPSYSAYGSNAASPRLLRNKPEASRLLTCT